MDATTGSDNAVPTPGTLLNDPILASRMRASAASAADNGLWNPRSHCPANMSGSAPSYRTPPVAVDHGEPVDQRRHGDGADRGGQVRHRVVMRGSGRQRDGNPAERSR